MLPHLAKNPQENGTQRPAIRGKHCFSERQLNQCLRRSTGGSGCDHRVILCRSHCLHNSTARTNCKGLIGNEKVRGLRPPTRGREALGKGERQQLGPAETQGAGPKIETKSELGRTERLTGNSGKQRTRWKMLRNARQTCRLVN